MTEYEKLIGAMATEICQQTGVSHQEGYRAAKAALQAIQAYLPEAEVHADNDYDGLIKAVTHDAEQYRKLKTMGRDEN